ncbi:hypothetical protein QBC38DRAFT_394830 [Podospora fimiseda]|uniref:Uncharacterized protein n=1 Tax=Podospora fimiseda TaxID=252190 RepID=A0AAN7GVJ3_9PEZI|nr:hypothetical protein QBC38DRAFT_394830 [Podospora fimiseda]
MMDSVSPTMMTSPTLGMMSNNNNTKNHNMANKKSAAMMAMNSAPMTYIPPLSDGACGTVPRSQHSMWSMMGQEMMSMMKMMPDMCRAMLTQRKHMSWADMGHMMTHTMLTCMEIGMMIMAVPMWMMLPGAMFAMWMGCCATLVMAMCWILNGKEQMHMCSLRSENMMMGQGMDNEKWMFMGGMGMSSRHCHKETLPMLCRMFGRPMMCVCMPTWGMPFDMMCMMLQRCMVMPSQVRRNLYAQMRTALLDDKMQRCVVMCHNNSCVLVSQAISQLCCDLPAEKMRKLEIYTFGSAASEFMLPAGESMMESSPLHSEHGSDSIMMDHSRKGVHVEHFAMMNDPFAQMGVLQGVRENMSGRYCGGVFVMNDMAMIKNGKMMATDKTMADPKMMRPMMPCSGLMMEDYMMALFPAEMMMCMGSSAPSASSCRSIMDNTMIIDRELAEKREIAAMSSYHAASHPMTKGGKRLSWTGLGAQGNGISAGMTGLEMARKGCKSCDGHKGREVSWLMRYMAMGNGMMSPTGKL